MIEKYTASSRRKRGRIDLDILSHNGGAMWVSDPMRIMNELASKQPKETPQAKYRRDMA